MTRWLEQIALDRVRQQFPDLKRNGFAAAVRALDPDLKGYRCKFVPDGWTVERIGEDIWGQDTVRFTCIEVEDSSRLTPLKLQNYADFWFALDCYGHELRLLVFDRYGLGQRELSLQDIWWARSDVLRANALKKRRSFDWPPPRVRKCQKPNEASAYSKTPAV